LLTPLLAALLVVLSGFHEATPDSAAPGSAAVRAPSDGRLLVVVVDSLRRETLEAPGHMPRLLEIARRPDSLTRDVASCDANFTLPCMQTMLEGRQSPFSTGLHNFTGTTGANANLIAVAQSQGLPAALASDSTLPSLYGRFADRTLEEESLGLQGIARDLALLDHAAQWLEDPRLRLVMVHVFGTDHVAHDSKPGSEEYQRHYAAVDEGLAALLARLDPARDSAIVLGDHGHDAEGHHTRRTLFIAAGHRYRDLAQVVELPATLDQTEIAWLMAYALSLPVPSGYEGRHYLDLPLEPRGASAAAAAHAAAFVAQQRASFAVPEGRSLAGETERNRAERDNDNRRLIVRSLPLLLAYLAWLALVFRPRLVAPRPRALLVAGVFLYSLVAVAALRALGGAAGITLALGLCALPIAVLICVARRVSARRAVIFLGTLVLLAGALGYLARPWADFFHTRAGMGLSAPIFYVGMPFVGLGLAWLLVGARRRWHAVPEASLAFAVICLPPGVYYYQWGQNLLWGFLLGVVLMLLWRALRRPSDAIAGLRAATLARAVATLVFVAAAAAVLTQESGGWVYTQYIAHWLGQRGLLATVMVYAVATAAIAMAMPARASRAVFLAAALAGPLYASGAAKLPLSSYAAAQLVVLLAVMALYVPGAGARRRHTRHGFLLAAGAITIVFFEMRGFFLQNVDFTFALRWTQRFNHQRDIALLATPLTALKYCIAVVVLALAVRAMSGPRHFVPIAWSAIVLGNLKVLALIVQSLTGRLDSAQKLYELAIGELCIVTVVVTMLGLAAAAIQAFDARRVAPLQAQRL
jgi:hypothetical protein